MSVFLSKFPDFNSNDISAFSLRSISIYPEILKAEMSFHQVGEVLNVTAFKMPLTGRNKTSKMFSAKRGMACSDFCSK